MKNLKLITLLVIALTTIISCSKDDDETTPTFEELLVENSPWKFNGLEFTNVVYTGSGEFDVDEYEEQIRAANENVYYNFYADGTGEIIDNNDSEVINWEILENNQFKISTEDGENEIIFSRLQVTNTNLEFSIENMSFSIYIKADIKYLLSK